MQSWRVLFMKVKEFLKNNLAYLIALICNLAVVGFLFAPLLSYEIKYYIGEEKIKEQFPLNIIRLFDKTYASQWLAIALIVSISITLVMLVLSFIFKEKNKIADVFNTVALILLALVFAIGFLGRELFIYFCNPDGSHAIENFNDASIGWGIAVVILLSTIEFFCFITVSSFSKQNLKTIAEDGMLIAAAFVLNFIKLPIQVQGSINFQMLPLMIIAIRRGPLNAFVCGGVIYGLLTCLSDGYGFATYPFDYLIGFGSVAILGFFKPFILPKNKEVPLWKGEIFILVGGLLSTVMRLVGGTTSSMVLYEYPLQAALAYNLAYVLISGGLAIAIIMLIYPALVKINKRYPVE